MTEGLNSTVPDFMIKESLYPAWDELNRLICKFCGQPYKSWSKRELLEKIPANATEAVFTCLVCRKASVFGPDELFKGCYHPASREELPSHLNQSSGTIRDDSGHLTCTSCGAPAKGFTVKGAHSLLGYSEEPFLWIACESCRATSIYSAKTLRNALPEAAVEDLQPGDELFGLRVLRVLHGGMSTVYICSGPSGLVAAKTLRPELARIPGAEARFKREAEAWILLGRHPHIVEAKVILWEKSRSILVTEYQRGGSLADRLARGSVSVSEAVELGVHFCRGMEHARSIIPGFVHRDIKPHNCLLGEDGLLKIADFGLVKMFDNLEGLPSSSNDDDEASWEPVRAFQTRAGKGGMGTLPYMAPEQFEDASSVTITSDVYAFGVLLFETLTRKLPITLSRSNRYHDWHMAHASAPIPYVREYDPSVPEQLSNLIRSCLAKSPADRPADFGLILDTLMASRDLEVPDSRSTSGFTPPWSEPKHSSDFTDIESLDLMRVFNLTNVGRVNEALAYADHIIRVASLDDDPVAQQVQARGHALRAGVLRTMGRLEEASEAADAGISLNPADALALFERGFVYNVTGDYDAAVRCLAKSYHLDPLRPNLPFELAFAYNALEQFDQAIEVLLRAIKNAPDNYIHHREIAYSYAKLNNGELAKQHYERGFALCPASMEAERAEMAGNLGQMYLRQGDAKSAEY